MDYLSCRLAAVLLTTIALALPQIGNTAPRPAPTAQVPVEERLAHISITRMGDHGDPVILIPGLATPRAVWDGIAPAIARSHRVYLVQVNGFGGDDPGANLGAGVLEGVIADLHGYVERHHLQGARVIGHSLGGLAAMMFARAHPREAARLLIVDSLPFFGVLMAPPGAAVTTATVEPTAAKMREKVAASYGSPADPTTTEAQVRGLALKSTSIAQMTGWAKSADPRVTAQAMYEDLTTDLRTALVEIATPMTVIVPINNAGPFTPEQVISFYKAQYAGALKARFVSIADAGHFVMLDQPEAFANTVSSFLAEP